MEHYGDGERMELKRLGLMNGGISLYCWTKEAEVLLLEKNPKFVENDGLKNPKVESLKDEHE